MRWSEGHIHLAMRHVLRHRGWKLIAGEFPGGSDHELCPLNVVDPTLARDRSPAPRRHSFGELIPDLVALRGRDLFIGEAKVRYDDWDRQKLELLVSRRRKDLLRALDVFAIERKVPELLPVETLLLHPTLVFRADDSAVPPPVNQLSYLRIVSPTNGFFEGPLKELGL
jgi:hypothetical protein